MGNGCSVEGCDRPHEAHGYCRLHYRRFRKHGDPLIVLPPKPYSGKDDEQIKRTLLERRNITDGCWEYTRSLNKYGYGAIGFHGKVVGVHRVAYLLWNGPIAEGLWVLHRCDNPPCFNPEHLFLGTAIDNNDDMTTKGRANRIGFPAAPTSAQRSKRLTETDVLAIRASADHPKALAERHGISVSYVRNIIARRKWAELSD